MPIMLDDLDLSDLKPNLKAVDPKFFSAKLTGNGKKLGLLNENLLPVNRVNNSAYQAHDHIETKSKYTQYDITTSMIPFAPLTRRALQPHGPSPCYFSLPVPDSLDRFEVQIATGSSSVRSGTTMGVFFDMTPQAGTLYEDHSGDKMVRDFVVQYRMELFRLDTTAPEPERVPVADSLTAPIPLPFARVAWNTNPLTEAAEFINETLRALGTSMINPDELDEWLREYSVYDRITRQAQIWTSDIIAEELGHYIDGMPSTTDDALLNGLAQQLRYLENYNIPLDAYRVIHKKIESVFTPDIATQLSKQNLNLLMNHTLDHLDQMKTQLAVPTVPAGGVSLPPQLSKQQLDAVTTTEPLVMTQAGAGTGKSSTILHRIDYLQQCGIDAKDITVLSFTNAAADNIVDRNPNVGSMTIARMIHDIYSLNHPTHELSSIDTIINSLDIFYPNHQVAASLRMHLLKVDKNEAHAFTAMNTFIEYHFDEVMTLLDTIKQTSLELEIIICYQKIDSMAEPPHVRCKYLIIDEVQDNSIFEFIYVLKYVSKHALSLFIVGDASQTLFEFRSANPRALNTLEGSGVFATYQLTTNYRSNQEILDFANVVLNNLETNQLANIQLQANALALPTAQSFQDKVTIDYRASSQRDFRADLPGIITTTVAPDYIQGCLDRGEKVAFLAYARYDVALMQEALATAFPSLEIANLVGEKTYATDIFSKYIKHFWNDVLQMNPSNASFVVDQGIKDNMSRLVKNLTQASEKAILSMLSKWWLENCHAINAWVTMTQNGSLSDADFFDRLRENLLSFEISHNAVKQSVVNQRNRERKAKNTASNAPLVVSTIHGAKGLEFDNVVIVHHEDSQMSEADKRLYYVAFTRAMNSEYVLSYGQVKNAPIESNYTNLVKALETRDEKNAMRAAGIDPDAIASVDSDSDGPNEDAVTKDDAGMAVA